MTNVPFRPLEQKIGHTTIRVEYADITTLHADALVSSDDIELSMGGGVSMALVRAGGPTIFKEARRCAPIRLGDVAVTTAGRLSARYIFHAAVLDYSNPMLTTLDLIRQVVRECLEQCRSRKLRSIAFPALATGTAGFSPEQSAVATMLEAVNHVTAHTSLDLVTVALFGRPDLSEDVLPRFYGQVSDFLELAVRLKGLDQSLGKIEDVYRQLDMRDDALRTRHSRGKIRKQEISWEAQILDREASSKNYRPGGWQDYRRPLDNLLQEVSVIGGLHEAPLSRVQEVGGHQPLSSNQLQKLEMNYVEYRCNALREMILIRRRNLTDIELEQSRRGFSIDLNRQLEVEKTRLTEIEGELRKYGRSV